MKLEPMWYTIHPLSLSLCVCNVYVVYGCVNV
jgi:hypothetical protein